MFLLIYCTLAMALFFWMFGFLKAAGSIVVIALAVGVYALIRWRLNKRRRTITNKNH